MPAAAAKQKTAKTSPTATAGMPATSKSLQTARMGFQNTTQHNVGTQLAARLLAVQTLAAALLKTPA
jgi:hypothetical protein